MKKGYIVLENGQVFEGQRFGYDGNAIGELVFNTSAVGYIETLTDACYQGQILVQKLFANFQCYRSDHQNCCHIVHKGGDHTGKQRQTHRRPLDVGHLLHDQIRQQLGHFAFNKQTY